MPAAIAPAVSAYTWSANARTLSRSMPSSQSCWDNAQMHGNRTDPALGGERRIKATCNANCSGCEAQVGEVKAFSLSSLRFDRRQDPRSPGPPGRQRKLNPISCRRLFVHQLEPYSAVLT